MKKNRTIRKLVCVAGLIGFVMIAYFGKTFIDDLPTGQEQEFKPDDSDDSNASDRDNTPIPQEDDVTLDGTTLEKEGESQDSVAQNKAEPMLEPTPEPTLEPKPTLHPTDWNYENNGYGNMPYPEEDDTKEFPYEIRINKLRNTITIYEKNKNGKFNKPVKAMVCSVGRATPLGTFRLKEKYYWKSLIHDLWGQYSTRITGRILFHSVPYTEPKKDKLMESLYGQLGNTASAGCVRLTTIDAKWILENCPTGTNVVIYDSYDPGPLGKPEAPKITTDLGWDPTDPDTRNPLNFKDSKLKGVRDRTIERGSSIDYLDGVVAFDKATMSVSNNVKIKTELNVNRVGSYNVRYVFKDSTGKKFMEEATFTVTDTTPPQFSGLPSTHYIKDKKEGTKKSLLSKIRVTDNGKTMDLEGLTVEMPDSIKKGTNLVRFTITDDFGNEGTFTCKVVLVTKPPILEFKKSNKDRIPLSRKVNKDFAKTRVTVKDETTGMTVDDLRIDVEKKNWGYRIRYTAVNKAGYTATLSETVTYETYRLEVGKAKTKTVSSIRSKQELLSFVKVKSDLTDKTADAKVRVKTKKVKSDKKYDYYNVTYQCTYKSPVGKKTETANTYVRTPRN